MLAARVDRKRRNKLQKLQQAVELSKWNVQLLENELQQTMPDAAPEPVDLKPTSWFEPSLPCPPGWSWEPTAAKVNLTAESINELTEADLKQMVLDGTIDTAITDSGATSSCGMDTTSNYGQYQLPDPFVAAGKPSNKIFQYGGRSLGVGKELKHLPYDVHWQAKEIHTVPGQKNHLMSTKKIAEEDHVHVFDNKKVSVYDANDVKIITTHGAILRG